VTRSQRLPSIGLIALGIMLALLGLAIEDERAQALLWILAVPMVVSGVVAIAWGNASREVERYRDSRDG
jgi:uncharacterized membrane protein